MRRKCYDILMLWVKERKKNQRNKNDNSNKSQGVPMRITS